MTERTAGKRNCPAFSRGAKEPFPQLATSRLRKLFWFAVVLAWSATMQYGGTAAIAADIADAAQLYRAGKYRECAELCGAAIEAGEYSETWRLYKIRADLASGHYADALPTLEAALTRYRTSIRIRWLGHQVYRWNGNVEMAAEMLDAIDLLTDGASWRYSDPLSRTTLGQFQLYRGADPKRVLDEVFGAVKQRTRSFSEPFIASAELALEKHDYAMAADEFRVALEVDRTNPDIHFGLALAFASSSEAKVQEHLEAALKQNPHHVPSLLFLSERHLDSERYDEAEAILQQILEVNPTEPRAWSHLAVLAHLRNDAVGEEICRNTALLWWSGNPDVDYTIGEKLSRKYRFVEAAAYQRQALTLDPTSIPAKIALSQDLLRLGREREGWELAEQVYEDDAYNVVAHNLTTLRDQIDGYVTLDRQGIFVRMEPREAEIYGARVLELLVAARQELCAKYDVVLEKPVLVEIFPEQQDFAIRTFGLPGGQGFLGVCFGNVVTANSPASQAANPTSWESVLWHEFCHVVTLNKTKNKMPRWLSEGISVYEERQRDSSWSEPMSPTYRTMILDNELTPVSQLSGAFLQPPSGLHLQFAYFESGMVVEFLIERFGFETLRRVLVDLSVGMPINESLQRYTGSLAALDDAFAEYATERANQFGAELDWESPDFPARISSEYVQQWNRDHPDNFYGLQYLAVERIRARQWELAKAPLERMRELLPEYAGEDGAYALLARVHRELGETTEEQANLKALIQRRSDAVDAMLRLLELASEDEDWEVVLEVAEKMLAVNPLQRPPHRYLAQAAEALEDSERAAAGLEVLATLSPHDPADVHHRLALHLARLRRYSEARQHILKALEEAPRFRDAHRTFLEILSAIEDNGEPALESPAAATTETDS